MGNLPWNVDLFHRLGKLSIKKGSPMMKSGACLVEVVLFDFGGVLAEEGFREGLLALGKMSGLDPNTFMKKGFEVMHESGYATGKVTEDKYWQIMRDQAGIEGSDESFQREILSRFVIRSWMIDLVIKLKEKEIKLGILSDQTNWLDELNKHYDFFKYFDRVYNSYQGGKSKRDITLFKEVIGWFSVDPDKILFIDDHPGNIERANQGGLKTILYKDRMSFMDEIIRYCPFLKG
jgi:putative hydrolase of the HAD superfamily